MMFLSKARGILCDAGRLLHADCFGTGFFYIFFSITSLFEDHCGLHVQWSEGDPNQCTPSYPVMLT